MAVPGGFAVSTTCSRVEATKKKTGFCAAGARYLLITTMPPAYQPQRLTVEIQGPNQRRAPFPLRQDARFMDALFLPPPAPSDGPRSHQLLESLQVVMDPQNQLYIAWHPLFHPNLDAICGRSTCAPRPSQKRRGSACRRYLMTQTPRVNYWQERI